MEIQYVMKMSENLKKIDGASNSRYLAASFFGGRVVISGVRSRPVRSPLRVPKPLAEPRDSKDQVAAGLAACLCNILSLRREYIYKGERREAREGTPSAVDRRPKK